MLTATLSKMQEPPRQVRVRRGARWFFVPGLVTTAVIIAMVVAVPMWFLENELNTLQRLEANGKFAHASLEKLKFVKEDVDANYVFTVAGQIFSAHKDCGHDQFPSLYTRVLYWPNDPRINLIRDTPITRGEIRHLEKWYWSGPKFAIAIFVGVVVLIALPFAIIPGELNISRQLDLARRGVPAEAVVTRLVRDSSQRCRLHYDFPTNAGTCRGNSLIVARTRKQTDVRVGQHLTVLFDPYKPRHNILVLALDAVDAASLPTANGLSRMTAS
jgi:hypothetical protein